MPNTATEVADLPAHDHTPAYRRLTRTKEALILRLSKEGHTQAQIAHMVGCSQPSVSNILSQLQDTRELARLTLNNGAQALAERVIADANVEESLEVLDRLGVAEKRQTDRGNSQVQVIVAMPGQAQLNPPAIDVEVHKALSPPPFAQPSSDE